MPCSHLLHLTLVFVAHAAVEPPKAHNFLGHYEFAEQVENSVQEQPQILKQPILIWDEANKLSFGIEVFLAGLWIALIVSAPFVVPYLEGKDSSITHRTITCVFLLAVLGGFYLFTNVIIFNSSHFKEPRTLTLVECIYLMSQVITTVGYGDITPAYPVGQVFIGLYVLVAMLVIANLVSVLVAHVQVAIATYKENIWIAGSLETPQEAPREAARSLVGHHPEGTMPSPSKQAFLSSLASFAILAIAWVLFFHFCPGEGKTWMESIYMSVITLTTVGFGAVTPNTPRGQVFASFFMLFGTAALASVITTFSEFMLSLQEYERHDPEKAHQAIQDLKEAYGTDNVDAFEVFKLCLIQQGILSEKECCRMSDSINVLMDGKKKLSLKEIGEHLISQ